MNLSVDRDMPKSGYDCLHIFCCCWLKALKKERCRKGKQAWDHDEDALLSQFFQISNSNSEILDFFFFFPLSADGSDQVFPDMQPSGRFCQFTGPDPAPSCGGTEEPAGAVQGPGRPEGRSPESHAVAQDRFHSMLSSPLGLVLRGPLDVHFFQRRWLYDRTWRWMYVMYVRFGV